MLVDPGMSLPEEVRMITGITDTMLRWRVRWDDIREKIRDYIGDAIIVGHNVLFDIAMLRTHGIDLSNHIVLDTFELSEIFSQDAESLNLLFLARKYNLPIEGEHRALDDTKLSVWLFILYLEIFSRLSEREKSIFSYFSDREDTQTIQTLFQIAGKGLTEEQYSLPYQDHPVWEIVEQDASYINPLQAKITPISLSYSFEEHVDLFRKIMSEHGWFHLITQSRLQSQFWDEVLMEKWFTVGILAPFSEYISFEQLWDWMSKEKFSRKELIFSLKILIWLEHTETGKIDELKYYGEEYTFRDLLRCSEDENSYFHAKRRIMHKDTQIIISEAMGTTVQRKNGEKKVVLIEDVYQLEKSLRKHLSKKIDFSLILYNLEWLSKKEGIDHRIISRGVYSLSYLCHLIESCQARPTGESLYPPGEYGETYSLAQDTLWQRWWRWLVYIAQDLLQVRVYLELLREKSSPIQNRILWKDIEYLGVLAELCLKKRENIGCIVSIDRIDTTLTIISRDMRNDIQNYFSWLGSDLLYLMNYWASGPLLTRFLRDQCGLDWKEDLRNTLPNKLLYSDTIWRTLEDGKSYVYLSTNLKHLRTTSQEWGRYFSPKNTFIQGISGGKWKILSLYKRAEEEKILYGLIESWINEYELWKEVDIVLIGKIPFDPPTDPYFLAKTKGMKNNFEEYSCPLAIAQINTLIGRIYAANPNAKIICIDDRISLSSWWKKITDELI